MAPSWAYAFAAAALFTLAATPVLRRVALATDFIDHPMAAHKSHQKSTPYLGGLGLIAAVLVGLLFTSRLTPQVAVVALGGSLIGCLGLLDDHRAVGALFRFGVEMAVAAVAVFVGLRINATDVAAIDSVITMIWIVGTTNAVNLLDNMDGLAAGVAAAASVAIFALAVLGEQLVTATVAAGMAGACAGFLVYNKRPASIFMGDTGSLFLGFVLGVLAIGVDPALDPPASFAIPLMLLALPVLDTVSVTVSRLRRGRSISQGGKDHLSHRLVAGGLSPGVAVGILVAVEATVGMLAVLAGRQVISLVLAVVASAVVLAGLAAVTMRAPVYTEAVVGMPRPIKLAAAAGGAALLLVAAPATVALLRAYQPALDGASSAGAGLEALASGDAGRAGALFDEASRDLGRAAGLLDGRPTSFGLLLPGLRVNVATVRALVEAGREVVVQASSLSAVVEASALPVERGTVPVAEARRLAPELADSASVLQGAAGLLAGYDRPYLWPSLGATVRDVRTTLLAAASEASTAAEVARLLPAITGEDGPRRYFLAVQDNAELRGAGGVPRLWGELVAEKGRLRLAHMGPIEELNRAGTSRSLDAPHDFLDRYRTFGVADTWQNVTVSPDFSVTGEVISDLYPQSGGRPVDGVVAVDLPGLAALLDLAGPVTVGGRARPLTGADVLRALTNPEPPFSPEERQAFLAEVAQATVQAFTSAELGTPARLAAALRPAVGGGHLLLYAARPEEERLFDRLGVAGRVAGVGGDSLLVVNQNLTATPVDAHLHRRIRYDVALRPDVEPAVIKGRVEVTLRNQAARDNRTELSIYSPLGLSNPLPNVRSSFELGRRAYSSTVPIPPGESRTLAIDVEGGVRLAADGWYHLDLPRQTSLLPDETEISLSVPPGWRIADTRGGVETLDSRHAKATLRLDTDHRISLRLERSAWSRLWARIRS